MSPENALLIIKALDPHAKVAWSDYTQCFYIESNLYISDGVIMSGGTEHRATRDEAILAFLDRLTGADIMEGKYVLYEASGYGRQRYTWNGAAFSEIR